MSAKNLSQLVFRIPTLLPFFLLGSKTNREHILSFIVTMSIDDTELRIPMTVDGVTG